MNTLVFERMRGFIAGHECYIPQETKLLVHTDKAGLELESTLSMEVVFLNRGEKVPYGKVPRKCVKLSRL